MYIHARVFLYINNIQVYIGVRFFYTHARYRGRPELTIQSWPRAQRYYDYYYYYRTINIYIYVFNNISCDYIIYIIFHFIFFLSTIVGSCCSGSSRDSRSAAVAAANLPARRDNIIYYNDGAVGSNFSEPADRNIVLFFIIIYIGTS